MEHIVCQGKWRSFYCVCTTHTLCCLLVRVSLRVRPGVESANRACGLSVDILLAIGRVCVWYRSRAESQ